jgi:hypothetical protein
LERLQGQRDFDVSRGWDPGPAGGACRALPEQLVAAIHTLVAGEALIAPAITKRLIEQFARA